MGAVTYTISVRLRRSNGMAEREKEDFAFINEKIKAKPVRSEERRVGKECRL